MTKTGDYRIVQTGEDHWPRFIVQKYHDPMFLFWPDWCAPRAGFFHEFNTREAARQWIADQIAPRIVEVVRST